MEHTDGIERGENKKKSLVLTVKAVAGALQISEGQVHNFIESGDLYAIDISSFPHKRRHWRIVRNSLEKFVAKRKSGCE